MHILLDLLHLVAAATLAMLGFGYERDEDCPPVQLLPTTMEVSTPSEAPLTDETLHVAVSDCDREVTRITLPAL